MLLRSPLRQQDYPRVKHWDRRPNDTIQLSVLKVYDTDLSDNNSDSEDNTGPISKQQGVLAFLELKNGKVIGYQEKRRLYAELRAFWNHNIDPIHPPNNWSSAGTSLQDKFPFLRLCAGRWKFKALWKKNYHSWKRSLLIRQARKTPLKTGGSEDGSKRKREESPKLVISSCETDTLQVEPESKKAKTSSQLKNAMLSSKVYVVRLLSCFQVANDIVDESERPFVSFTNSRSIYYLIGFVGMDFPSIRN